MNFECGIEVPEHKLFSSNICQGYFGVNMTAINLCLTDPFYLIAVWEDFLYWTKHYDKPLMRILQLDKSLLF